jgi:2-oxo-3-hexenedioate decarboxylase
MTSSSEETISHADAVAVLEDARKHRADIAPFTDTATHLDEAWGYDVQALDRDHRLARGEVLMGAKLGLTSEAKQRRMGLDRPIVGFLTEAMALTPESVTESLSRWIHPRIEPEIAFITSRPIAEPLDFAGVMDSVGGVSVAAEVIDSRFIDYRFQLPDVIADNTSAAGVLLGDAQPLNDVDELVTAPCTVRVDGQLVHEATGAAILGHPLRALVWLSRHLAARSEVLPAGSVVLAGALTDAVPLRERGSYHLEVAGLGTIEVQT